MSYESDVSRSGAAGVRLYQIRKDGIDQAFYHTTDLSAENFTAEIRLFPDASGSALASPSVTAQLLTLTYAEWLGLGIITADLIPDDATESDDLDLTEIRMTLSEVDTEALPRNDIRGEQSELVYTIKQTGGDTVAAGSLILTETA